MALTAREGSPDEANMHGLIPAQRCDEKRKTKSMEKGGNGERGNKKEEHYCSESTGKAAMGVLEKCYYIANTFWSNLNSADQYRKAGRQRWVI